MKNELLNLLFNEARSLTNFNYLVSYTLTTRDKQLDQQERWRKHILRATQEVVIRYKLMQQARNNLIELPSVVASNYEGLFLLNVTLTSNQFTGFIYTFLDKKEDKKERNILLYIYDNGELIDTIILKQGTKNWDLVFEYRKIFEKQLAPMRSRINTMQYKLLLKTMQLIKKYLNE